MRGLARLLLACVAGAGARARTAAREARVRGQPGTCIVTAGETRAWNDGPSEGSFEALIVTAGETPATRGLYRHRLQHCTELQPHTTAAVLQCTPLQVRQLYGEKIANLGCGERRKYLHIIPVIDSTSSISWNYSFRENAKKYLVSKFRSAIIVHKSNICLILSILWSKRRLL